MHHSLDLDFGGVVSSMMFTSFFRVGKNSTVLSWRCPSCALHLGKYPSEALHLPIAGCWAL